LRYRLLFLHGVSSVSCGALVAKFIPALALDYWITCSSEECAQGALSAVSSLAQEIRVGAGTKAHRRVRWLDPATDRAERSFLDKPS
jgi:hypothetical protein